MGTQLNLFALDTLDKQPIIKLENPSFYMLPSEFVMIDLPVSRLKRHTYFKTNNAGISINIKAAENNHIPSGKYARLIMLHMFTYLSVKNTEFKKKNTAVKYMAIPSISQFKNWLGVSGNACDAVIKEQLFNILNAEFTINSSRGNYNFKIADYISYNGYGIEINFSKDFLSYLECTSLIKIDIQQSTLKKIRSVAIDLYIKFRYKALQYIMRNKELSNKKSAKLQMLYKQSGLASPFAYFKKRFFKLLDNENSFVLFTEPI